MAAPGRRWKWARRVALVLGVGLVVAVGAFVLWANAAAPAEADALARASADNQVTVTARDGVTWVCPVDGPAAGTGIVFYPGARVEAPAYVATWAPIVARTGVRVAIPDVTLNLAVLDIGRADDVRAAAPDVRRWVVGGHSLGGAMAASYAGRQAWRDLDGLVLWAAYATEGAGLTTRDDLPVLSVTGARDGLATPADVAARRGSLPPATVTVGIGGMNHAQFGRYGDQAGDLPPQIDDDAALEVLTEEVSAWLEAQGLAADRAQAGDAAACG